MDEAQARGETAGAKATIAADCGRAYLSALGSLFDGDSVRTQVAAVRKQLAGHLGRLQGRHGRDLGAMTLLA